MTAGVPSNLVLRLATAAVGLPVIIGLLYLAPPGAFYGLVLLVSLVGLRELLAMTHPGDRLAQAIGVAISAAASLSGYLRSDDSRALLPVFVGVALFGPLL